MNTLVFTATVVKRDIGHFVARADELGLIADAASTERGAIRKLKDAVLHHLRKAADNSTLMDVLHQAGYPASALRHNRNIKLEANAYSSAEVVLPLPRKLSELRSRKNK